MFFVPEVWICSLWHPELCCILRVGVTTAAGYLSSADIAASFCVRFCSSFAVIFLFGAVITCEVEKVKGEVVPV